MGKTNYCYIGHSLTTIFGFTDKNLFSYCDNNPITRTDSNGYFWETFFDIASIGASAYSLASKPSWANAGYLAWDVAATAIPFVPGSYTAKGLKVASKSDDVIDTVKTVKKVKIHNNSLKTTKSAQGYALVNKNTKNILKFGETTRGSKRYSKKYLNSINAEMKFLDSGSKYDMHLWQHDMIRYYEGKYGKRPPLNKSRW